MAKEQKRDVPLPDYNRYLDVLDKELTVKGKSLANQRILQIEAFNRAEADNKREFEKFKLEHDLKIKDKKLIHKVVYIGSILILAIAIFSFYLILVNNPIGSHLLTGMVGIISGLCLGWGIKRQKSS